MNENEAFKGQRHGMGGVLPRLRKKRLRGSSAATEEHHSGRIAGAPERTSRITCMSQSEGIPVRMSVTLASTA